MRNQFTPTKRKHYNFSPHDLTNWCKGLLRYQNSENVELEIFVIEVCTKNKLILQCYLNNSTQLDIFYILIVTNSDKLSGGSV